MRIPKFEPLDRWQGIGLAVVVTALATGINSLLFHHVAQTNLVMVYLLGVSFVASRTSPSAGMLASFLGVAAYDFFFVHPSGTFAVSDVEYVFTFAVMLVVSLSISTLTVRLREQSKARGDAALHVQVEQARGDLLSAVSHDLRTPLACIEGSASVLLKQPDLSEQSRQLAVTVQEESIRMGRLIQNLLDMTRVQGVIDLDLEWYGLDELAANAIMRTESMFDQPATLTVDPLTPLVRVDGVLFEQVLVNILENAARHAGKSSRVEIAISQKNDRVRIDVKDEGPGINPGDEEKIFERFQGARGTGFGLGLAICKAAVRAHGGEIRARNNPDKGACITIELPIDSEVPRV